MNVFEKLKNSKFRSSFKLKQNDIKYIENKGISVIQQHAEYFIKNRLADKSKFVDGKQTPMHGHPVFIAQHATATCCRECLYKWHKIEKTHILSDSEKKYIISIIMRWIKEQIKN